MPGPRDPLDLGTPLLSDLDARVEAALFAANRPLLERDIQVLLPDGVDVHAIFSRLRAFWSERGVNMERGSQGWIMKTRPGLAPDESASILRRMSEAAGATLMTIAMHQPITVKQIESIRGVNLARGIIESLEASGLVKSVGRKSGSGRAIMWEVTEKFLEWADIDQLSDLPTPEEAFMLDIGLAATEKPPAAPIAVDDSGESVVKKIETSLSGRRSVINSSVYPPSA